MTKFDPVKYNNQYNKDHYEEIKFRPEKDRMIKSRLETLCISTGKSKNQLITEAVEKLLQDNDL